MCASQLYPQIHILRTQADNYRTVNKNMKCVKLALAAGDGADKGLRPPCYARNSWLYNNIDSSGSRIETRVLRTKTCSASRLRI